MLIGLYLSILKTFIIPLGFTATATICLLMILKKCMRGYVLCQRLSCQNLSFYFVLNLYLRPLIYLYTSQSICFNKFPIMTRFISHYYPIIIQDTIFIAGSTICLTKSIYRTLCFFIIK